MNGRIKINAPGRPSGTFRVSGVDQKDFARKAAIHIRSLAQSYGISALAMDYDVISD